MLGVFGVFLHSIELMFYYPKVIITQKIIKSVGLWQFCSRGAIRLTLKIASSYKLLLIFLKCILYIITIMQSITPV